MIQVCSACGTRWNVRDRRRAWCPRCQGALLAPSQAAGSEWSARPGRPAAQHNRPRLPPGYRWIAVRPGTAPPPHRRRRELGPTPRYPFIPRWGLVDHVEAPEQRQADVRGGPSAATVSATLIAAIAVFGAAALIHLVRYAFLIVNRSVLLNPWVAGAATWLGVVVSVLAIFALVASAIVLTNWLIARRAAAFAHRGRSEPRPLWTLRAGCLVPLVSLAWAPVYVIELAGVEERLATLRRPIAMWWLVWIASTVISIFSIATSFASDAQGIADNTVTTIVAYLLALAALLMAMKVVLGFERRPVERPVKRWVIVSDDHPDAIADDADRALEPAAAVESEGENPAA